MPTYSEILSTVAALQNDAPGDVYTPTACLPYLNTALRTLQEHFELNNIPVTKHVSAIIEVDSGIRQIGFATTPPLPVDLIEIQKIWESERGLQTWIPVARRHAIPLYMDTDARVSQFLLWAWIDQKIELLPANRDNDLRIEYIKSLFIPITIATVGTDVGVINAQTYLEFKTAALCSLFIGENESRAMAQDSQAIEALDRSLGISTKGKQPIPVRRRPFRGAYKSRASW